MVTHDHSLYSAGTILVVAIAALLLLAFWSEPSPAFGPDASPELTLSSYAAGASSEHRLSFHVTAGEPELYRAVVLYAPEFVINPFDTLGPPHSPIGAYALDLDFDDVPERTVILRSLTSNTAYADLFADEQFSSRWEPVLLQSGNDQLDLIIPFGGDADPETLEAPLDARVTLTLSQGLITSPPVAEIYSVIGVLTSVDPDTDGPDDGENSDPERVAIELFVAIEPPPDVRFSTLTINAATLRPVWRVSAPHARRRLWMRGHFELGPESDGTDAAREGVVVSVGAFTQVIPAGSFVRTKLPWHFYWSPASELRLMWIRDNGRFHLYARSTDLGDIEPDEPVPISLRIGDDFGEAEIRFGADGRLLE